VRPTRRQRRVRATVIVVGIVVVAAAGGGWWYYGHQHPPAAPTPQIAKNTPPAVPLKPAPKIGPEVRPAAPTMATTRPVVPVTSVPANAATRPTTKPASAPAGEAAALVSTSGPVVATRAGLSEDPTAGRVHDDTRTGNAAIEAARKLYDAGKVLEARQELNALLGKTLRESEETEARTLLARIADETIFGKRNVPGDPLVEYYTIQSGDRLIKIAPKYDVPHEIIMVVNGITDAGKIREGQKLKVPRGPFNVKIYKSKFRIDVYLQDVYVRSYRVGLGTENGTPEGKWRVKNRLTNPTYYPPASSPIKRVVPPDDPANPLGEHWIGLEGVEGDAVGHEGYGIHGTIEPESVGKAVSLGCIRMHNEDVAFLYKLLLEKRSTVTILP